MPCTRRAPHCSTTPKWPTPISPHPTPRSPHLLTKAYGLEGTAGNQCFDAGATNKKLLAESERNGIKAEALYQQVLQRIRQIDGRSVSTTTTTDNSCGSIFG